MNFYIAFIWLADLILMFLSIAAGQKADAYIAASLVIAVVCAKGKA